MRNALPVTVALPPSLARDVSAFVEIEAGWQVVSAEGPPRPCLALAAEVQPSVPTVVVHEGRPEADRVRGALLAGAVDVVAWPEERARLLEAAAHAGRPRGPQGPRPALVEVAGCAGGVGTSTVALAVGGLLAWSGRRALVVGGDDLLRLCGAAPWDGPGALEVAALDPVDAAREASALAHSVPGVPGLSVLGGGPLPAAEGELGAGWPWEVIVLDRRSDARRSGALLVARPDGGLAAAHGWPRVLVNGPGPLDGGGARRLLGRPPLAVLAPSARVAQAGVRGLVPSALPGRWLAELRAALAGRR